jgi:ubiquitin carboxyl-terminal hydrolase 5/13
MADGLLSGRYSHPRPHSHAPSTSEEPQDTRIFQEGIKPSTFKALIGKGHVEFSTMKQQDAEEFLTHLVKVLRQSYRKTPGGPDPTEVFRHGHEQSLKCSECGKVSYRVDEVDVVSVSLPKRDKGRDEDGKVLYEDVQLDETLDMLTSVEALDYRCPSCRKNVVAYKSDTLC